MLLPRHARPLINTRRAAAPLPDSVAQGGRQGAGHQRRRLPSAHALSLTCIVGCRFLSICLLNREGTKKQGISAKRRKNLLKKVRPVGCKGQLLVCVC